MLSSKAFPVSQLNIGENISLENRVSWLVLVLEREYGWHFISSARFGCLINFLSLIILEV